jgi:hypothetical protein
MTFRQAWLSDWRWRLVDAGCHVTLALLLPSHWYFQYAPDLFIPVIWLSSFTTNKLLAEDNPFLIGHLLFHDLRFLVVLTLLLVLLDASNLKWLTVQWFGHLVIDRYTHEHWNSMKTQC